MERSSSGLSNKNLGQKRAIPKYGLAGPRRTTDLKSKTDTPSELEKKSLSTVSLSKMTPAPSFLKIRAPTKITKAQPQETKEVDININTQNNQKKNELHARANKQVPNETPVKQSSPKHMQYKFLTPKQSPKQQQTSARSPLNTVRSKLEQVRPTNVKLRSKLTASTAKFNKTNTQTSVTDPVPQKSASYNQILDAEYKIVTTASQKSLQQQPSQNITDTSESNVPSIPSEPNIDITESQPQATIAENIANKNAPKKKYNFQLPKSRGGDTKKSGSVDSVNTLGHGDHEGQPHAVSGRDRVMENKKLKLFETVEKQLETLQTDFMNKYESLKATSPDKLKNSYKFVTMVKGNDCKLMLSRDDILKIPKKIPASSVSFFKEKIKDAMDKNLATVVEKFKIVRDIQNGSHRIEKMEEVRCELEKQVVLRLDDLYREIEILCEPRVESSEMELIKLQRDLLESNENNKNLELRLHEIKKRQIEEKKALEIEMAEKNKDEVLRLDKNITDLNRKLKQFEKETEKLVKVSKDKSIEVQQKTEQLERFTSDVNDYRQKLLAAEKKIFEIEAEKKKEKDEKQSFAEKIDSLERMLQMSKQELKEFKKLSISKNAEIEQRESQAIQNLNKEIEIYKQRLCEVNNENENLNKQMEKFEKEHIVYGQMRSDYIAAKERIRDLEAYIDTLSDSTAALPIEENLKLKTEIEKLRESESEKRRDIDKLKIELAKELYRKVQLEEHLKKDEELLDARANLINDLQNNEQSYRQRCEALMVQNADRQRTIHEVGSVLNSELQTKSQEFRHLQESLREKCEVLSRQDHMIHMLEQSNERNQKLRIKNEEKIARLEAEKRHLRDTIRVYQRHCQNAFVLQY